MLNILEINDFSAPELDIYARRTEAQLLNKDNPKEGLFIAESPKVIGRALDAGYIPVSALVEKRQGRFWRGLKVQMSRYLQRSLKC